MDNNENMDNIIPQDGELNNETEKDIVDNQDNNINMPSNDYQENNNIANNEQVQNDNQCNDTIDDLNEEDSKDNDRVTVEPSVKFSAENLLTKLNSDIKEKEFCFNCNTCCIDIDFYCCSYCDICFCGSCKITTEYTEQ